MGWAVGSGIAWICLSESFFSLFCLASVGGSFAFAFPLFFCVFVLSDFNYYYVFGEGSKWLVTFGFRFLLVLLLLRTGLDSSQRGWMDGYWVGTGLDWTVGIYTATNWLWVGLKRAVTSGSGGDHTYHGLWLGFSPGASGLPCQRLDGWMGTTYFFLWDGHLVWISVVYLLSSLPT